MIESILEHPVLGDRLLECTITVLGIAGRSAHDMFGSPDDLKLRSCATLFSVVSYYFSMKLRLINNDSYKYSHSTTTVSVGANGRLPLQPCPILNYNNYKT
ncbi:DUF1810 family protein [Roseofilum sp. Guam]|uniref:DUF1810 family protein n=1 Tax=Roseofilum sp. Guam TaxID=2821502 RepID=UPI001B2F5037|nr:DUF1810 family protein [Roseofilum sp. Guam]